MDFLKSFFTPFIKVKIIYNWMSCIILCIWLWDFVFAWEDAWMTRKNGLNGQNTFIYYVCSIFCSYMFHVSCFRGRVNLCNLLMGYTWCWNVIPDFVVSLRYVIEWPSEIKRCLHDRTQRCKNVFVILRVHVIWFIYVYVFVNFFKYLSNLSCNFWGFFCCCFL